MNKFRFTIKIMTIAIFMFAFASLAQAQATRTWVSGVGDDVNPCSRTAPCKTFAGAISKTADGGEIDCIDPGGFGAVTLTKSVTIDGAGTMGSILAAGTNGVNVNDSGSGAPMTKVVRLRNLSIQGAGTGFIGINYTSAKAVYVENCVISGFKAGSGHGIFANLTADGGLLTVTDTIIEELLGDGIRATATTGSVKVVVVRSQTNRGAIGMHALRGALFVVSNSAISNNTTAGVTVEDSVGGAASANLDSCVLEGNNNGVTAGPGGVAVRLANNNFINHFNAVNIAGGTVFTYGDNKLKGNGTDVTGGTLNTTTTKQ
jgi:hypothetical protein